MTKCLAAIAVGSVIGVLIGGTIFFISIEMLDGRTAVSWILNMH